MNYSDAKIIADALAIELTPACERIEVVGSLRRRRPTCHDIDIVAIPHFSDLRDGLYDTKRVSVLDVVLEGLEKSGRIMLINRGDYLKRGVFPRRGDFAFDIYVATPATWATLLLIRTGSKEHNIKLCTHARDHRMKLHANGEGVTGADGKLIQCETEEDVFRALGLTYVKPEDREC